MVLSKRPVKSLIFILGWLIAAAASGETRNLYLPPWHKEALTQPYLLTISNLTERVFLTGMPCCIQVETFEFAPTNRQVQIPMRIDLKKARSPIRIQITKNHGQGILTLMLRLTLIEDPYLIETKGGRFLLTNISETDFRIKETTGDVEIQQKGPRIIAGRYCSGGVIRFQGLPPVKF